MFHHPGYFGLIPLQFTPISNAVKIFLAKFNDTTSVQFQMEYLRVQRTPPFYRKFMFHLRDQKPARNHFAERRTGLAQNKPRLVYQASVGTARPYRRVQDDSFGYGPLVNGQHGVFYVMDEKGEKPD